MKPPEITEHEGIAVARDDLLLGGTKTRFLSVLFDGPAEEIVYASPAEGAAQSALAICAQKAGKRATVFVAKRAKPHPRSFMAKRYGAKVLQVAPGYLTVVQARARAYCEASGATLAPFGVDMPEAIDRIAEAARATDEMPDEVWCAAGSGVLARALAQAWPQARRCAVQIGRALKPADVAGAEVFVYPRPFGAHGRLRPPFPSDPHYDAKAWEICRRERGPGRVLFWNVAGPADP